MCVIIVSKEVKPSLDILKQAEEANPHGGGIAWHENGIIRYRKGLTAEEIYNIALEVDLPIITHFRIATQGEAIEELCHPFPVEDNVRLALEGSAKGVLFHNGTVRDWKKLALMGLLTTRKPYPKGANSDTRAVAWLVNLYGESILSLLDGYFAYFKIVKGKPQVLLYGNPWTEYQHHLVSNVNFARESYYGRSNKRSYNNQLSRYYNHVDNWDQGGLYNENYDYTNWE